MSAILKQKLIDIANGFTKYGLWKGGGSGGSSALSEMTDVIFTDLQENDILTYNGSVWVNGDALHEYSTEEKIVGKWIDGKMIYEKVINGTMIGSTTEWVNFYDCTSLNIDNMINISGFFNFQNIRCIYIDSRYTSFSYDYNSKYIQYNGTGIGYKNLNATLIIQYTKQHNN